MEPLHSRRSGTNKKGNDERKKLSRRYMYDQTGVVNIIAYTEAPPT
jgi:hypothetical protein